MQSLNALLRDTTTRSHELACFLVQIHLSVIHTCPSSTPVHHPHLSIIHTTFSEVMERKAVRAPESRKYAEPSAVAGCTEDIIPQIPVDKGAETELYHTPASLQPVPAPWLSLPPPFAELTAVQAGTTLQGRADSPRSWGCLAR